MFERFTQPARQVIVLAQEEARMIKHNYIGTEHILLGLLREEEGLAARALESLGITAERVRAHVVGIVGSGEEATPSQIPFTPRAKKVLELALREALRLGHDHVDTEHILLGVVRENQGVAARVLLDFDADAEKIRHQVIRMAASERGRRDAATGDLPATASPAAPAPSTGQTKLPEVKRLSDDELDEALDRAIDQLIREEQDFSSRRRILHDNIDSLRTERNRRRRHDD